MTGRPPRIYVCGPFRAATEYQRRGNIARAERVALDIAATGAFYACPHLHSCHFDGLLDDIYWLELALDMLRGCDALVLVGEDPDAPAPPGGTRYPRAFLEPASWNYSSGSLSEVMWCDARAVPVISSKAELDGFMSRWWAAQREEV